MWLILQQVTGDSITKGAGIGMPLNMKHGLFALCEQTIVYIIHIQCLSSGDLLEDIILGSNDAETIRPKSPAALAFNSQRKTISLKILLYAWLMDMCISYIIEGKGIPIDILWLLQVTAMLKKNWLLLKVKQKKTTDSRKPRTKELAV